MGKSVCEQTDFPTLVPLSYTQDQTDFPILVPLSYIQEQTDFPTLVPLSYTQEQTDFPTLVPLSYTHEQTDFPTLVPLSYTQEQTDFPTLVRLSYTQEQTDFPTLVKDIPIYLITPDEPISLRQIHLLGYCLLVKVTRAQNPTATQLVPRWWIGEALTVGSCRVIIWIYIYITYNMFEECHSPCTLKTV
jgi:hypothetical protein